MKKKNILVLEDDPDGRKVLQMALEMEDISCIAVGTTQKALTALREHQIDGALIDYYLAHGNTAQPVIDILEVLQVPYAIMSATTTKNIVLHKPFSLDELYEVVLSMRNKK